jgi:two-component system, cell cycle response regulator DivK
MGRKGARPGKALRRGSCGPPPPHPPLGQPSGGDAPAVSPLVLIVDDTPDSRELCAEYLTFHKYRVAMAADGLEGLTRAHELLPDLILMDLSLPDLDGWEATRRLKADARTRHIPVAAFTAHALRDTAEEAIAAGCDAVITKPVLLPDFIAEIRRLLKRQQPA